MRTSPLFNARRTEFEPPCTITARRQDADDDPIHLSGNDEYVHRAPPVCKDKLHHQGLRILLAAASFHESYDETNESTVRVGLGQADECATRDAPDEDHRKKLGALVAENCESFRIAESLHESRSPGEPNVEHLIASQQPRADSGRETSSSVPSYQLLWENVLSLSTLKVSPQPQKLVFSSRHDDRFERHMSMSSVSSSVSEEKFINESTGWKDKFSDKNEVRTSAFKRQRAETSKAENGFTSCPPSPSAILARRIKRVSFTSEKYPPIVLSLPDGNIGQEMMPKRLQRGITFPHLDLHNNKKCSHHWIESNTGGFKFRAPPLTSLLSRSTDEMKQPSSNELMIERIQKNSFANPEIARFFYNCDTQEGEARIYSLHGKRALRNWACDHCHQAIFPTYEEACEHEKRCQAKETLSEGSQSLVLYGKNASPSPSAFHVGESTQRPTSHNLGKICITASGGKDGGQLDEEISVRDEVFSSRSLIADARESSSNEVTWYSGCVPLSISKDSEWLSDIDCFVRQNCVQAFSATEEDILTTSKRGRISLRQVGIRCAFCASQVPCDRATAAVSYPVSISGIYESVKRWQRVHLQACQAVPDDLRKKFEMLRTSCVWVPTTRQYWSDSARALGMVDTPDGIRFERNPTSPEPVGNYILAAPSQSAPPVDMQDLIREQDRDIVPPYVYMLMEQVKPCRFTEADRFLARSKGPIGFAGFECRHCSGHAGLGKYFPTSSKSLSTNSTSQNVHSHLLKCRRCPQEIKKQLELLKDTKEKAGLSHGWRKMFFERVWIRMHG